MVDTTTLAETLRSPIDGTEYVRLATTGANWKATLSSIVSTLSPPLTLTDGTNTVADVAQITVTGGTVGGTTPNATLTSSGGLTVVTADTTYFVDDLVGSNSYDGLSATWTGGLHGPFATIQHAVDVVSTTLIMVASFSMTIQVETGTGVYDEQLNLGAFIGSPINGFVNILGNSGDYTAITLAPTGAADYPECVVQGFGGGWEVRFFTIDPSNSNYFGHIYNQANLSVLDSIYVNAATGSGSSLVTIGGGTCGIDGTLTAIPAPGDWFSLFNLDSGSLSVGNLTVNFGADPAYSGAAIEATAGAAVYGPAGPISDIGTPNSGPQFNVTSGSRVSLGGLTGNLATSVVDDTSSVNGMQGGQTFTVATLPPGSALGAGARAVVTDALAPVFGAPVAAGGGVTIPVYYDASNSAWYVG